MSFSLNSHFQLAQHHFRDLSLSKRLQGPYFMDRFDLMAPLAYGIILITRRLASPKLHARRCYG